jgi:D-sedoheptulose 7-phosphate isomerase
MEDRKAAGTTRRVQDQSWDGAIGPALERTLDQTVTALRSISPDALAAVTEQVLDAYMRGGTVYIFGNGGSASTAEHFVCDLAKGSRDAGDRPLSVVAPSANSSLMTALANDISFADVFAEQLDGVITDIDLAIAISASGNSPNVLRAVEVARQAGAFSVGLIGFKGGLLEGRVDLPVVVDSDDYGVVENVHLSIEHAVTAAFKAAVANQRQSATEVITDLEAVA